MKSEIARIFFGQARVLIAFVSAGPRDYNLEVMANAPAQYPATVPLGTTAVGATQRLNTGEIIRVGAVFIDRLRGSMAQNNGNTHPDNIATGLGRAGAHEILHYLLQQAAHDPGGVMSVGFRGDQWYSDGTRNLWTLNANQIARLRAACNERPIPVPATQPTLGSVITSLPVGGGGGSGRYAGGGFPSWYYDLWDFVNWVQSITTESMDNPTVTVCSGGICN